jgi:hypothetical protein
VTPVKPTQETRFCIDERWWQEQGRNMRAELWAQLCPDCRAKFPSYKGTEVVDWVDPETGEVHQVDGLWYSLRHCCSQRPGFLARTTGLMTAIFRLLLASGNEPLSPLEMWQRLGRGNPEIILRLLLYGRRYYGIQPCQEGSRSDN